MGGRAKGHGSERSSSGASAESDRGSPSGRVGAAAPPWAFVAATVSVNLHRPFERSPIGHHHLMTRDVAVSLRAFPRGRTSKPVACQSYFGAPTHRRERLF